MSRRKQIYQKFIEKYNENVKWHVKKYCKRPNQNCTNWYSYNNSSNNKTCSGYIVNWYAGG